MANSNACTHDPLALDNQVCFLLYSASRAVTAAYRPLLTDLELTYPQYLVMLVMWEANVAGKADCKMTVGQICEKLYLETGTITPLIKRLELAGLLTRKRLENDERVVCVSLTEKGEALKSKAAAIPGELLCRLGISPEALLPAKRMLEELNQKLLPLLKGGE
ncbi:MAG: MarR family transcriptional regulator [Hahellaceae bacterium]|nr:MarR family transcriptional regulator [Hahellaceae bacterium]